MSRIIQALCVWMLASAFLCLVSTQSQAAGERKWVKRYGYLYAGADYPKGMLIDKNNHIIVAGISLGGATTYYDYAVVKYDSTGKTLWARRYSGPTGLDEPYGVAVDAQGNILVTGKSLGTRGVGLPDILTVKYDTNGNFKWARRYYATASGVHEEGRAVATDAAGNVFVAGIASSKSNTYQDAVLIKYNAAGVLQWAKTYDGPMHDNDGYFAVAVDGDGNVVATGFSYTSGLTYSDVLTVKYNTSGTRLWKAVYDDEEGLDDWAESIAIDKQNNVIVTGSQGESCEAEGGYCFSYATIKYSPAGARQWVAVYNPQPTSDDKAHAVKVDAAGNVYVTGESAWKSAFYDFATVKYSPDGTQRWAKRYDGVGHGNDAAWGLAIDSKANVIVAGNSYINLNSEADFTVIKYSTDGVPQWVQRYNGPGDGIDMAFFVGVDSTDNVYASGFSVGTITTAEDFVTIKYAP
jgi:uncharacterized delta-60 repeat protein